MHRKVPLNVCVHRVCKRVKILAEQKDPDGTPDFAFTTTDSVNN